MPKKKITMMDIVHPAEKEARKEEPKKEIVKEERPRAPEEKPAPNIEPKPVITESPNIPEWGGVEKKVELFEKKEIQRFEEEDAARVVRKKKNRKRLLIVAIILMVLGGVGYGAMATLPRAAIAIVTKKVEWSYVDGITVTRSTAGIDATQKQIPGELFVEKKSTTVRASASGKRYVERKASGKIKIYNAYSSTPQRLTANTRFTASDGKILYLEKSLTIPGAKIEEGKIIPSSIEAALVAPAAGTEYNLGMITKFQLPGFLGTSKYQGFYAVSETPLAGGFVGEMRFLTEEDIRKAKETAIKEVRAAAEGFLELQIPREFKVIEGSKQFTITKENIATEADAEGLFTVYEEGELAIMAFRESDIEELMKMLAIQALQEEYVIASQTKEYGVARLDVKNTRMSFALTFNGSFQKPIDKEAFQKNAAGLSAPALETLIYSLPGVERATVSFWPKVVVRSVPKDIRRITIEIQ